MTPEGRMDPQQKAREAARQSAMALFDLNCPNPLNGQRSLYEMGVNTALAELNLPVPPPSADARAKLESLVDRIRQRAWTVRSSGELPYELSREEAAALLALPPHEGETPHPAAEPSGWREIAQRVKAASAGETWEYAFSDLRRDALALLELLPPVVQTRPEEPTGPMQPPPNCPRCYGSGYIPSETCTDCVDCQDKCPRCGGTGHADSPVPPAEGKAR